MSKIWTKNRQFYTSAAGFLNESWERWNRWQVTMEMENWV
jgi:hypothetical protein